MSDSVTQHSSHIPLGFTSPTETLRERSTQPTVLVVSRHYGELLEESSTLAFPGLVLAQTIWQAIGSSPSFRLFSPGYVWQPYEGEVYKPLIVSSDLKSKLKAFWGMYSATR